MPDFHIDYSPNLEMRLDMAGVCMVIRDAAAETELFPTAGLRIRATPAKFVVTVDRKPDHAYLDRSIRLRAGRDMVDKRNAVQHNSDAAERYCADLLATSSFMLSYEMRGINADLSPKVSSIRRYLPEETS